MPDEKNTKVPRDEHGNVAPPPQGLSEDNKPVKDTDKDPPPRPGG